VVEKVEPATLDGIERYLGSGLIKGIGPTYARRLVSAFGLDTLRVLSEEPHRILEVQGIGKSRAQTILRAWEAQRGMRDVMVFLQGHGVGSALALRIYRAFGSETVARVKENPYCLAREVYGIGFALADRIARSMGISGDSPLRVQAGLLHVLGKFSGDGHCFVPLSLVMSNAAALLGIEGEAAESAVKTLARQGEIVLEEAADEGATRVYPRELYHAEARVAAAIRRLLSTPSGLKVQGTESSSLDLFGSSTLMLEEEQREAITQALRHKVLVVTGGPGTGKTTLLVSLLAILRRSEISFALAAPTGRAAKRMSETAGEEAKTIHRLLEYNPRERRFLRGEDNPVDADAVVIDEASMVDLPLMDHLLRAVEPHSHLILLGDVDQLPSVGPGSVLRNLIDSGAVPVVVLRRIFRQSQQSLIVVNAHRILQGQPLVFGDERDKRDFIFVARENEEEILEVVKQMVQRCLQGGRFKEAQILTPVHRGLLGTVHLNRELQKLLNPTGESLERGETLLRRGDKVMQLKNNYDKAVFNGDLGRIVGIDREAEELAVDFDGRAVSYGFDELDELSLAYAISVHKSQGSEYGAVFVPLHTSHYMMLHRSILYTAVTRGREMVVLIGSKRALSIALRNIRVERRFTGLKERLTQH
jgi:exodeoxyribonuclease V alpha subunit